LYANVNANISTSECGDRSFTFTNYTVDCESRFITQADTPKRTSIKKFYWYRPAANIAMFSITREGRTFVLA